MQYKISNAGVEITPKRGAGCESVNSESPMSITGVVEGEFLCIYEGKPSYKLIINSNNTRYRVSGYDATREGETITCIRKDAEIGEDKKKVYWYTQGTIDDQPQPQAQQQPEPEREVGA